MWWWRRTPTEPSPVRRRSNITGGGLISKESILKHQNHQSRVEEKRESLSLPFLLCSSFHFQTIETNRVWKGKGSERWKRVPTAAAAVFQSLHLQTRNDMGLYPIGVMWRRCDSGFFVSCPQKCSSIAQTSSSSYPHWLFSSFFLLSFFLVCMSLLSSTPWIPFDLTRLDLTQLTVCSRRRRRLLAVCVFPLLGCSQSHHQISLCVLLFWAPFILFLSL